MTRIQDLVAMHDTGLEAIAEAQTRVVEARQEAHDIIEQLHAMDIGGSTIDHLQDTVQKLDETLEQLGAQQTAMEKSRQICASAEFGLSGQGGGTTPPVPLSRDPHQETRLAEERSGEDLVEESHPKKGAFTRAFVQRADSVDGSVKDFAKSQRITWTVKGESIDPPRDPASLSSHTIDQPRFEAAQPAGIDFGTMAVSVVASGIAVAKGPRMAWRKLRRVMGWRSSEQR